MKDRDCEEQLLIFWIFRLYIACLIFFVEFHPEDKLANHFFIHPLLQVRCLPFLFYCSKQNRGSQNLFHIHHFGECHFCFHYRRYIQLICSYACIRRKPLCSVEWDRLPNGFSVHKSQTCKSILTSQIETTLTVSAENWPRR